MATTITATGTAQGRYTTEITAGRHRWLADEPEEDGGRDQGPTPYGLLLSALGACTAITLRLYAERKGWPLEDVRVQVTHERIHALDCAECEATEGYLDRIETRVVVSGPLSWEQVERLKEIAVRCPVHRTLAGQLLLRDSLVHAAALPAGPA